MMKRVLMTGIILISMSLEASIFDDIGSGFKSLGNAVYQETIKPLYRSAIKPAGQFFVDTGGRLEACANMVGLGTEWATKQAALHTAQTALEVSNRSAYGVAFVVDQLGKAGGQGINIEDASFEINARDMSKGTLITLQIKGVFFGKRMHLKVPFDISDATKTVKKLCDLIFRQIVLESLSQIKL